MESKKLIIALFIFVLNISFAHVSQDAFTPARDILATVKLQNFKVGMWQIGQLGLDVAGVDVDQSKVDLVLNDAELEILKKRGFSVDVVMTKSIMRGPDAEYKNPDEIASILEDFAARFPEIAELKIIGQSVEGRNIYALKISDNAKISETDEPKILFNSMHHAREVMSPEVSLDIIEYLLTNYGSNEKVDHWVNSNEIYVVPMLNVDGNNKVWAGSAMWRKNTRNGYGVDLNRNYPYAWGACNGSSRSTSSDTYRGPNAGSEPEAQALMNLVKEIRPVFDISYHSYSELVLYPFGCEPNKSDEVIVNVGKELGQLLKYKAGTPWELLYNADGGDIDWMYAEYQVISFVIELNSTREGFQPSYKQWRQVTVERNRVAWQKLLDKLDGTGFRGVIKNFAAGTEAQIEVLKNGSLFKTQKVNPDGTFHIILEKGSYELKLKSAQRGARSIGEFSLDAKRQDLELSL